jgi:hypothetical protein
MARRAFLYTGITFLIMASILIMANYWTLSQQAKEESQVMNLEIDALHALASNLNGLLASEKDNVIADALSDATFFAINSTSTGLALSSICKNALDPTNEDASHNISAWILSYINSTLFQINQSFLAANIDYKILSFSKAFDICIGSNELQSIDYSANISYSLAILEPPYVQLNTTLLRNKTLEIRLIDEGPESKKYGVTVIDETGRIDFNQLVNCRVGQGLCEPN